MHTKSILPQAPGCASRFTPMTGKLSPSPQSGEPGTVQERCTCITSVTDEPWVLVANASAYCLQKRQFRDVLLRGPSETELRLPPGVPKGDQNMPPQKRPLWYMTIVN